MANNTALSPRVLHVVSELAPLIKTGGLGDVAAALPKALRRRGADARAVIPAWPGVLDKASDLGCLRKHPVGEISVALNWRAYTAKIWKAVCDGVPVYILDQPELFCRENIYPESAEPDAALPFIFLSLAPFELPAVTGWVTPFFHTHDWQSAALPAALRWHRYYARKAAGCHSVFTIHNIAHQGIFEPTELESWGFRREAYSPLDQDSMEFYGNLSLMKGALTSCDAITTVSPRYSREIQTPDYGFGLDGVIRTHKNKLKGILNGIDLDIWNPETDKLIAKNYSASKPDGKIECRRAMLKKIGWEEDKRPVLAFVGRLAEQKGVDIMLEALENLTRQTRAVIIGSGNDYYNGKLAHFARRNADSVYAITGFNEENAHIVYAGSDILLMPSYFEPCGLSQLIACAYGTVPVVRATGGLADTVFDADANADGNGFVFSGYKSDELSRAVHRALDAYGSQKRWRKIVKNAMGKNFSWDASAAEYLDLYNSLVSLTKL